LNVTRIRAMSTTFQVYPGVDKIPSFRQLLDRADAHLNEFLTEYNVGYAVAIEAGMRDHRDQVLPLDLARPAWWNEGEYAWFYVPGVPGGTDAYARPMDELDRGVLSEDAGARREGAFRELIHRSLEIGRMWSFRRSIGQPAIINVAYGFLAGSLAELTDGLVDSIDNGWDFKSLPARADEFLAMYFRPDRTEDAGKREWAARCIAHIRDELAPKPLPARVKTGVRQWLRRLLS
jgi:hypothetical protein